MINMDFKIAGVARLVVNYNDKEELSFSCVLILVKEYGIGTAVWRAGFNYLYRNSYGKNGIIIKIMVYVVNGELRI